MAFNLGIDVDGARVVAAVERSSSVRVVVLGRGGRAVAAVAHVGGDGTVRVGDEAQARAQSEPDGLVEDLSAWLGDGADHRVNGWAVSGDVLYAHLLAYVVRRSAQEGEELGRVTIAAPAGWSGARVAALREAAGLAGMVDVDVVPAPRAGERAPASVRDDAERAIAVGAAVLAAARRPAPAAAATQAFVAASSGSVAAPEPVTGAIGAVSVFGGAFPDAEPPARIPVAAPGAAGGGGRPPGDPRGPGGPDGFEPPGRNRLPYYIAGGVLGVLVLVLVLVLLLRGGDGDDTATSSSTTSSSTSSTSTSSTTTSSTTTSTTTTTTTTVPASTTTFPPTTIPRELGKAVVLESGLVLDYGMSSSHTLVFGDDAIETLDLLRSVLGGPDADTGWRADDACSGSQTRRVTWGDLEIVFSELSDAADEPQRTFEQWFIDSPGTVPPGLVTLERVGIGSLVADLRFAYPNLDISHPRPGDKTGFFTTESGDDNLIAGFTTDTTDTSKVTQMWAGNACQRLADAD